MGIWGEELKKLLGGMAIEMGIAQVDTNITSLDPVSSPPIKWT